MIGSMEGVVGRGAVALAEAQVVVQGEGWVWGTLVEEQVGRMAVAWCTSFMFSYFGIDSSSCSVLQECN